MNFARKAAMVMGLAVCTQISIAAQTKAAQTSLTAREVQHLRLTAHTDAEYAELEAYYRGQAHAYEELARDEQAQMRQALESPAVGGKSPTVLDHARTLSYYYEDRAEQARKSEEAYALKRRELTANPVNSKEQLVSSP